MKDNLVKCQDCSGKCFARSDGDCKVLSSTDFKGRGCPFKKEDGSVSNGKKYAPAAKRN